MGVAGNTKLTVHYIRVYQCSSVVNYSSRLRAFARGLQLLRLERAIRPDWSAGGNLDRSCEFDASRILLKELNLRK